MNRNKRAKLCRRAGLPVLLSAAMACGLSYRAGAADAPPVDYPVNVTISAGTCSVDVSPSAPPLLIVMDADMAAGGVHGETQVNVMTTDCLGVGETSRTPSVLVQGKTVDQVDPTTAGTFTAGQYLFTSPTSTVKLAGFVLSKTVDGASIWDDTKPKDTYVKDNDIVPIGVQGETCGGVTECKTTFWAGLACGTTTDCATHFGNKNNDGALSTFITFTFVYN